MRFADRDLSMPSASAMEYFFGTLHRKCAWLPPNPNVPNSKPRLSSSLNAAVQVSMCDCFLKQLYLHLVTNIIVTQLLRVSRPICLKLPLFEFTFVMLGSIAFRRRASGARLCLLLRELRI